MSKNLEKAEFSIGNILVDLYRENAEEVKMPMSEHQKEEKTTLILSR